MSIRNIEICFSSLVTVESIRLPARLLQILPIVGSMQQVLGLQGEKKAVQTNQPYQEQ